jgi:hypothetical protein
VVAAVVIVVVVVAAVVVGVVTVVAGVVTVVDGVDLVPQSTCCSGLQLKRLESKYWFAAHSYKYGISCELQNQKA